MREDEEETEETVETAELVVPTSLEPGRSTPDARVLDRWWPLRGQCPPFHPVADIVPLPAARRVPRLSDRRPIRVLP
jgi:hypothetical protein